MTEGFEGSNPVDPRERSSVLGPDGLPYHQHLVDVFDHITFTNARVDEKPDFKLSRSFSSPPCKDQRPPV